MTRLHRIAAVALLAFAALAPQSARASASFEGVSVIVDGYEVFGRLAEGERGVATTTITATLQAPEGTLRATAAALTTDDGGFELAFISTGLGLRQPVRIQRGDRLTLGAGSAFARALTVPDLLVYEFEVEQGGQSVPDQVLGVLRPGGELTVTANTVAGAFATRKVMAEAESGYWTADFTGALDIEAGSFGVAYFQSDGVTWQADWVARHIETQVGSPEIVVHDRPGGLLDVTLFHLLQTDVPESGALSAAWDRVTRVTLRRADGTPQPVSADGGVSIANGSPMVPRFLWRLPNFTLDVDPDAGTVGGTGDPGLRLTVQVPGGSRTHVVDETGTWRLELPDTLLTEDTLVTVTLPDFPYLSWRAYAPRVATFDPYDAAVTGRGTAGTPVSLLVHHAGTEQGRASGTVAADGTFALAARAANGQLRPRRAGDTWRVSHGRASVAYPIAPFSATADGGSRRVSGIASPSDLVTVQVQGSELTTTVAADGRWSLQFPPDVEMPPGTRVAATTQAPGGPSTRLEFPTFQVAAQLKADRIRIAGPAGLSVDAELERDGDTVATGNCTVARTECSAPLRAEDGQPMTLAADDILLVYPNDGATATLNLVRLTAHIDLNGHDVVGEAPPDAHVRIAFGHQPGVSLPLDATTPADGTGIYDHELSASEWSALTPGLWADVYLSMTSGHLQLTRGVLEVLRATPGRSLVEGLAEPGSEVTLALTGPANRSAAAQVRAGASGAFSATLRDGSGAAVAATAGDRLAALHNRGSRHVSIQPLVAWRDGPDGAVAGLSGPDLPIRAVYQRRPGPASGLPLRVDGVSDAAGELVLAAPALDPADVAKLDVVVTLPDGDELTLPVDLAAQPGRVFLPLAHAPTSRP
jgi:hypothetical protein